jgi:hypothetical protein
MFTLLLGCYANPYDLKYPDLKIKGKKANQYIVNRATNYGNGNQDGCIIGHQISLNIDWLSNDSIAGLVLDSKSKEPLYFSTIELSFSDNHPIDTLRFTANEKGEFNGLIKHIPKKIEVIYIGYKTLIIDLSQYKD